MQLARALFFFFLIITIISFIGKHNCSCLLKMLYSVIFTRVPEVSGIRNQYGW